MIAFGDLVILPQRSENYMEPTEEKLDVIAVGAHPDDVEIACGGTLANLAKQGYRVGIIDLTDGEPTPLSSGPEARLAEANAAAEMLGVHKRITLDLPNRRLFDSFEARVALAKEFRRFRPKVVLGFGEKTPMASPDHWQAMQITDAGVFYSRLTKWDDYFEGLPVHTIEHQLYFYLGFDITAIPNQVGFFTMDITDTLRIKMQAIECYKSQFPPGKQRVFRRVEHGSKAIGAAAGFGAGEILIPVKPIGSKNLMKTLYPEP